MQLQDLFTPAGVGAGDVPTLQLALGAAAAVYFMREQKRSGLGKALGLSLGGLVLGALLGSGLESWLRVDIVPLGVRGAWLFACYLALSRRLGALLAAPF